MLLINVISKSGYQPVLVYCTRCDTLHGAQDFRREFLFSLHTNDIANEQQATIMQHFTMLAFLFNYQFLVLFVFLSVSTIWT